MERTANDGQNVLVGGFFLCQSLLRADGLQYFNCFFKKDREQLCIDGFVWRQSRPGHGFENHLWRGNQPGRNGYPCCCRSPRSPGTRHLRR